MIHLKKLNLLNHKGLKRINDFGDNRGGGGKTYVLNSNIVNQGNMDVSTGEISGFSSTAFLYATGVIGRYPINDIDIHFKSGNDITTDQCILSITMYYNGQYYKYGSFVIKNNKLFYVDQNDLSETELVNINTNTEYRITGNLTRSGSSTSFSNCTIYENTTILYNSNITFSAPTAPGTSKLYYGIVTNGYSYIKPFLGIIYGDTNWRGTICVEE